MVLGGAYQPMPLYRVNMKKEINLKGSVSRLVEGRWGNDAVFGILSDPLIMPRSTFIKDRKSAVRYSSARSVRRWALTRLAGEDRASTRHVDLHCLKDTIDIYFVPFPSIGARIPTFSLISCTATIPKTCTSPAIPFNINTSLLSCMNPNSAYSRPCSLANSLTSKLAARQLCRGRREKGGGSLADEGHRGRSRWKGHK